MKQRRLRSDVFAGPERKQPTSFDDNIANHKSLARLSLVVKRSLIEEEQKYQRANRCQKARMNQGSMVKPVFHGVSG